ncbi:MAG: CpaD family pilus assembly lipoprotein [Pseudomonadota bacterium]
MNALKTLLAPRSAKLGRALGPIALSALVAGCSMTGAQRFDPNYPVTVEVAPYLLEIPAETALSSFDTRRIQAFGRDFLRTGDGELTIAYPSGSESGQTVAAASASLVGVGVPRTQIIRGPYSVEADGDRGVVLSYFAPEAIATACPAEPMVDANDRSNQSPAGFGCSVKNNVVAMLEDPRDAIAPRPTTPPSADRRHQVLTAYVAGERTAAQNESDDAQTIDE